MARRMPTAGVTIVPNAPHAMNFSAPDALGEVIMSMMDNPDQDGAERVMVEAP